MPGKQQSDMIQAAVWVRLIALLSQDCSHSLIIITFYKVLIYFQAIKSFPTLNTVCFFTLLPFPTIP